MTASFAAIAGANFGSQAILFAKVFHLFVRTKQFPFHGGHDHKIISFLRLTVKPIRIFEIQSQPPVPSRVSLTTM